MDFNIFGVKKTKTNEKNDEIGQMLVSGALDRTKTIRKTAADIFAKSGLEKTWKKQGEIKKFSGIFLVFPLVLAKNPWIPVQTAGSQITISIFFFVWGMGA